MLKLLCRQNFTYNFSIAVLDDVIRMYTPSGTFVDIPNNGEDKSPINITVSIDEVNGDYHRHHIWIHNEDVEVEVVFDV